MPDERLAYNPRKEEFAIVKGRAKLIDNYTTSISKIAKKINELVLKKDLFPEQIFNLKLNVTLLNSISIRYNTTISHSCFFTFLDKLIFILTFGNLRLKYSLISIDEVDERAQNILKPSQLDDELMLKLINYFSSDLHRVAKLPKVASVLLENSYKLSPSHLPLIAPIAEEYALSVLLDFIKLRSVKQIVFEQLFYIANHTSCNGKVDSIARLVDKELGFFSFQPYMSNGRKEMMLNLVEIIRKNSPERIPEVFATPHDILILLEYALSHFKSEKLVEHLFEHVIANSDRLDNSEITNLIEFANDARSVDPQLWKLEQLKPKQRLSLLTCLSKSKDPKVRNSTFSQALCNACLLSGNPLTTEEKPVFFELLNFCDPSLKSISNMKNLLIDLMDHIDSYDCVKAFDVKAIISYLDESTLNDDEKICFLKFLGTTHTVFILDQSKVESYLTFLLKNASKIPFLSNTAFELCCIYASKRASQALKFDLAQIYEHIDINLLSVEQLKVFIELPWFKKHVEQQLLKVDYEKICEEKFKVIAALPAFQLNDDIYLAKARDDILTVYYSKKEQSLIINPEHLFKPSSFKKNNLPTFPPGFKPPALNQLLTLFDQINFTDRQKENFYNGPLVDDDGQNVTPEELRSSLAILVQRATAREHYSSAPKKFLSSGVVNSEFNKFFDTLQLTLQHIIIALNQLTVPERSFALISLAIAGSECAMRHQIEAAHVYANLTGNNLEFNTFASAPDIIYTVLAQFRYLILLTIAQSTSKDVHHVNGATKYVCPRLGIKQDPSSDDTYEPVEWTAKYRSKTIQSYLNKVNKEYWATPIINAVNRHVNDPKWTENIYFRNKFMDAISSKLKSSGSKMSDYIIYGDPNYPGFRIKRKGLIFLLKSFVVLNKSSNPASTTLPQSPTAIP